MNKPIVDDPIAQLLAELQGDKPTTLFSCELGFAPNCFGRFYRGERQPDKEVLGAIVAHYPEHGPQVLEYLAGIYRNRQS